MGFEWANEAFRYQDASNHRDRGTMELRNEAERRELVEVARELQLIVRFLLENNTPNAEQRDDIADTLTKVRQIMEATDD